MYLIETSVIEWNRQVHVFLSTDSSKPIRDGLNPGPMTEIDFWKCRVTVLTDIYTQVVINILERWFLKKKSKKA